MTDSALDPPAADRPSIARVYDYLLGGSHNFASDRAAAQEFLEQWPAAPQTMRLNRDFLGRTVRYLAGNAGIRQFLDIGSGIPTMGNVHEIAQETAPGSRVVYADIDPVAVLHSQALLARNDNSTAISGDLRDPGAILGNAALRDLLDLAKPVALLLVAVLHFLPDSEEAAGIVAALRDALAPGSYLVISHGTVDGQAPGVGQAMRHYEQSTAPFAPRDHDAILRFFNGFDLIEPGLVPVASWRPGHSASSAGLSHAAAYGGVARLSAPPAAPPAPQEP